MTTISTTKTAGTPTTTGNPASQRPVIEGNFGLVAQLLRISYLHTNPWETQPWKRLIAENSPGHARIGAPILITQGEDDKLVIPAITDAYVEQLCREGERVQYRTYPGVDHIEAGPASADDVAAWVADRFAVKPAPSSCRRRPEIAGQRPPGSPR